MRACKNRDAAETGTTKRCFEREGHAEFVAQNFPINLGCGRLPSGCNHSLQTCPAIGIDISAWPAFFLKVVAAAGAMRQRERETLHRLIAGQVPP